MNSTSSFWRAPGSITAKLSRIYLVVAISALFCAGLIPQIVFYQNARTAAHENLKTQGAALAGNLEAAVSFADAAFAAQTLSALQHHREMRLAAVVLPDGKILARYGDDTTPAAQQASVNDDFMALSRHGVVQSIASPNYPEARLILVASLEELNRQTMLTVVLWLLLDALIVLASYAVFQRLCRTVTRPIEQLTGVMRRVERDGDYGRRAQIVSDDETGELAKGFNAMLAALEKQNSRLNTELEERKQIERQILAAKNQLQATLDAIPDLMFEVGLDGRFYDYHSPRTELLAAPPEVFLKSTLFDVLPATAANVCNAAIQEAYLTGQSSGKSFELALVQGYRWFELSVARKAVAAGDEPRFVVLSRDITERKSAELAQLASESKFRAIIEATPVPLALNDGQGKITFLNRAFLQTIGYTTDDIPTVAAWGRKAYPDPQYRQGIVAKWQNHTQAAERNKHAFAPLEAEIRCKDGAVRTFMISATPLDHSVNGAHLVVLYDVSVVKAAQEKIMNLAFYDPLTGLPNRRLLLDRLKHALATSIRSGRFGAVLFIDLDDFKTLNDTLGHAIGDLLLQQVAERLTTCVREGDTVGRLGGDEFVLILEDLSEHAPEAASQAEAVGEKILLALNQIYQLGSNEYHNTPSIGLTLFSDHQGSTDDFLKRADLAMYQAKAAGRNTLRFFDPEMQAAVSSRAAMEAGLREGLLKGQFVLYYQPQVGGDGNITGCEALVRWQHPQRGIVSPTEFIALAEESRVILPLGDWVLETACNQLARWAIRPGMENLSMAVNVSAHQFRQPEFVEQVLTVLHNSGANPQRLKLELTESLLVYDVEEVVEKMFALKARGVSFALDDFGTGYSSLSYLKRLPLDQLKIDQSFVRDVLTDPNDAAIARTIVALARSLGLTVIAEGVETEAQRDFLATSGCHAYQGYFFSAPLPIEAFEALVRADRGVGSARLWPECVLLRYQLL